MNIKIILSMCKVVIALVLLASCNEIHSEKKELLRLADNKLWIVIEPNLTLINEPLNIKGINSKNMIVYRLTFMEDNYFDNNRIVCLYLSYNKDKKVKFPWSLKIISRDKVVEFDQNKETESLINRIWFLMENFEIWQLPFYKNSLSFGGVSYKYIRLHENTYYVEKNEGGRYQYLIRGGGDGGPVDLFFKELEKEFSF